MGWFCGRIWLQYLMLSLLDCTIPFLFQYAVTSCYLCIVQFLFYSNTRSSNAYIYNSFPILIHHLQILIYTSTIESTKLCHIFIVIYRVGCSKFAFLLFFFHATFWWICFPHVIFLCFPYVTFFPFNFSRIFNMIFCSFFLHCTWRFWLCMGHDFLFFLKVVSDICLVVFSVFVIFICFSYSDQCFCLIL
jgi:hypothetical protein